ncbi:MAG: hypothetical protein JXN63_08355 [Candidatus Delongbacteria bacterium]|nr:hypothetical protein [Candidatus Delongbacteria bacterium]
MKYSAMRIILSALITLSILNCTKDDDPDFLDLPDKFPLSVGNKWDYNRTVKLMYKPDSTAVGMNTAYTDSTIELSDIFSEALKDTVLEDTISVIMVKSIEIPVNGKQDIEGGTDFYRNKEDGFYEYIHSTLKQSEYNPKTKILYKNKQYNSLEELKDVLGLTMIRDIAKQKDMFREYKSIEYPIEIGNEWDAGSIANTFTKIKKVIGREIIEFSEDEFEVYKIQTFWDWDEDGVWEEDVKSVLYLSKYGFVKTRFELWNLAHTDEFNNIIDYFDVLEEEVLTDYDVALE